MIPDKCFITTCERTPTYLHQTIASLYLAGYSLDQKLVLVMDSEKDWLPTYNYPNLAKVGRKDAEYQTIGQKAAENYLRCLVLAKGENSLVIEDDVVFHPNALRQLVQIVVKLEQLGFTQYILSLSASDFFRHILQNPSEMPVGYPDLILREDCPVFEFKESVSPYEGTSRLCFSGTFAIYYPALCPYDVILSQIHQRAVETKIPYDLALGSTCTDFHIPIFVCWPSLATHIGVETAGGSKTQC